MDKKSPKTPKRKSLANVNVTPSKVQKTNPSPKKNKSPAVQKNQKTPQRKQINGRQNTPKPVKLEPEEEEDDEVEDDSEDEQVQNGNEDSIEDQDDSDDDSEDDNEEQEQKPIIQKSPNKADNIDERRYSLFLGGLNYVTTEANIREHFSNTSILSVRIMKNPINNKPRGSAFINFKDEASVKTGLQLDGSELDGRTIKVSLPQKPDKNISLERKKNILASLKRKVAILEKEIAQGAGATSPKQAKVANKNSPKNKNNPNKKNKNKKIKSN